MGCYVTFTNRLLLGQTGRLSMEKKKWKYSKGILKIVKEMEIVRYRIEFFHFPLCRM